MLTTTPSASGLIGKFEQLTAPTHAHKWSNWRLEMVD